MTIGTQVSQVLQQICEECKQPFMNNGRNAQTVKRFCCATCASKNGSRKWRARQ